MGTEQSVTFVRNLYGSGKATGWCIHPSKWEGYYAGLRYLILLKGILLRVF